MTKRKKIIIALSILISISLAAGLYVYYRNKKIKADTAVVSNSVVDYYGFIMWSDGTPASGVAVNLAGRQKLTKADGSYYAYLSSTDFDKGNLNQSEGAPLTFANPVTSEEYGVTGASEGTTLPYPRTAGEIYVAKNFILSKPSVPLVMIGDTNNNGKIDSADATKVLRVVSGLDPTPTNICQYDVNKNGKIDSADATKILRFVSGTDKIDFGTCTP